MEEIRVLVESPYAGNSDLELARNIRYTRACLHDCLLRGEYPFASHLLYTQTGILNDKIPEERKLGIEAGLSWGSCAHKTVVYTDLGITKGMNLGIERAQSVGRPIEFRTLDNFWEIIESKDPLIF